MKKMQGSSWGKLLAVLLLLVTAFGAGHFALKSILNLPYVAAEDWQETSQFDRLLAERQEQLAQLCQLDMELMSGELSFVQQERKLRQYSQLMEGLR